MNLLKYLKNHVKIYDITYLNIFNIIKNANGDNTYTSLPLCACKRQK